MFPAFLFHWQLQPICQQCSPVSELVLCVLTLIFPICTLLPCCLSCRAMYDPLINVRGLLQYFTPFYMACNLLLLVLCVMQCVWFAAVMR